MKRILIVIVAVVGIETFSTQAQRMDQNYNSALGIKVWTREQAGVSYKHFLAGYPNNAVEGIAYLWYNGVRFTGLYQFYLDMGAPGLKWYVGPGAHLGIYNDQYHDQYMTSGNGGAFIGIDGVIGLDYKFDKAPINLSLDWQPSIEFGSAHTFQPAWGGIGLRYTFN
ncbi:MAG TPA: hypothetical protein PLR06_12895 [Cyclobacteriaceae bacterium]|nr:hypothetical protein [Cyclobacteriaceae bacterium]